MLGHFSRYGIPGLALFVVFAILSRFNFDFERISSSNSALVAVIICTGVIVITLVIFYLNYSAAEGASHGEDQAILLKYEQLVFGLSSPKQNVLAIEDIANSAHRRKEDFLKELQKKSSISFIEQDAISNALRAISARKQVSDLYPYLYSKESKRWEKPVDPSTKNGRTWMAIWGLKLWRYVNRKDHPQFKSVEEALARVTISQSLDEKSYYLFNSLDIKD